MMKRCPFCAEEILAEAIKCKHCGEFLNAKGTVSHSVERPLTRSSSDSILAGVCGGVGAHLNMDANLVRILFAIGTFATLGILGVVTYIIMAFVLSLDS